GRSVIRFFRGCAYSFLFTFDQKSRRKLLVCQWLRSPDESGMRSLIRTQPNLQICQFRCIHLMVSNPPRKLPDSSHSRCKDVYPGSTTSRTISVGVLIFCKRPMVQASFGKL